jgi:hypothetical protein
MKATPLPSERGAQQRRSWLFILTARRERSGDHHGNLLPMRRSNTNEHYRASNMPRLLGRLGYQIQADPE